MISRFEDLWNSAGDGAASPLGLSQGARPDAELEALMDAWFRERQTSIECRLNLDEATRLLRKLMEVGDVPQQLRRRTRHLLRAVRDSKRGGPAHE